MKWETMGIISVLVMIAAAIIIAGMALSSENKTQGNKGN